MGLTPLRGINHLTRKIWSESLAPRHLSDGHDSRSSHIYHNTVILRFAVTL
jgi:hypothetical protein